MKKQLFKWKNNKGFTLVEMVIVLFIISLLSLLFIPNITQTKEKVQTESKGAFETVIKTQAELYKLEKGSYPTSLEDLKSNNYINEGQLKKGTEWGTILPSES